MKITDKIGILFSAILMLVMISVTISTCASNQRYSDNTVPSPGDMNWPEHNWMYRHPWAETFNKVGDDEDYNFEDYSPASAVYFDKHKRTGLCFAFYGRSFIQAPSWACNKK